MSSTLSGVNCPIIIIDNHSHGPQPTARTNLAGRATTCLRYIQSKSAKVYLFMSSCMLYHSVYINTMTTRLNNSMIMVHLIRSLLINLNSMIAIEAKYVELCKYTVAYVGLHFLQRCSAVAEGSRNACRFVLCQSCRRCVVWRFRYTLPWTRIGQIGAFGRGGDRSLCAEISHGKGQAPTHHFWRGQSAGWTQPLSRQTRPWTRPYHSALCHQWRQSFRIPRCVSVASGRQCFNNQYCFD